MFDSSNQFNVFDKTDGHLLTVGRTAALIAWYANGAGTHCSGLNVKCFMSRWTVYVESDNSCFWYLSFDGLELKYNSIYCAMCKLFGERILFIVANVNSWRVIYKY